MHIRQFDLSKYDPVGKDATDRVFHAGLSEVLSGRGFECINPRKWVRSSSSPIRHLFVVQPMKGASYALIWGISLDYVPHLGADKVLWHRTPKSAMLDLRFDPIDYDRQVDGWQIDSLFGATRMESGMSRILKRAWPLAAEFFDSARSIEALPLLFERQMAQPGIRFSFQNYVQQPLAYLFTLATLGDKSEAQRLLSNYAQTYQVSTSQLERLSTLVAGAGTRAARQ